jgi:hypothetical protein
VNLLWQGSGCPLQAETGQNSIRTNDAGPTKEGGIDGRTIDDIMFSKVKLFPATPFLKGLLPEDSTKHNVVGAVCSDE